jgi:hypothetical protein
VEAVARALSTFGREARMTIDETDALGDADTADIFTEVSRGIDKWLWFVEAHTLMRHSCCSSMAITNARFAEKLIRWSKSFGSVWEIACASPFAIFR